MAVLTMSPHPTMKWSSSCSGGSSEEHRAKLMVPGAMAAYWGLVGPGRTLGISSSPCHGTGSQMGFSRTLATKPWPPRSRAVDSSADSGRIVWRPPSPPPPALLESCVSSSTFPPSIFVPVQDISAFSCTQPLQTHFGRIPSKKISPPSQTRWKNSCPSEMTVFSSATTEYETGA